MSISGRTGISEHIAASPRGGKAGAQAPAWYKTAMAPDVPRRRRARPVADAPIDALLADNDQLAKGWVLALVESAPLHEAPGILTDALTRDGPRVCDAVVRALVDENDLRRLAPGGALRPLVARVGEMTGAGAPGAAARAVDALHDVMWSALRAELGGLPDPVLVSDLAERLALVCAAVRDAVLEGAGGGERELSAVPPPLPRSSAPPVSSPPPPASPSPPSSSREPRADRAPLWLSALEEEVRHSGAAAAPLSLLLTELEDADRVIASASPERAGAAFGDFVAALRRVLRRQDILVWESDARAWVIARETSRAGAHSLGMRIAEAVGESTGLSGAPLVASVGVAVLGEDGLSSGELIDAAEEARFAASARGVEVSRRVPES
jgi:GGDEF domain-containing protein